MAPEMTFRQFWEWRVGESPEAVFVHHGADTWTYAEFDRSINALANGMARAGVGAGTKVALFLDNSFELLRVQWAAQKLGAIWVPVIPTSTAAEARYVLGHSEADVLLVGAEQDARLAADGAGDAAPTVVVQDDGGRFPALESGDASPPPDPGIRPMDPMALMYTSGSTGKPKGVLQPNTGFRTIADAYVERLGIAAEDVWICTLPLFHSAATHLLFAPTMAAGCSIVLCPRFSRTTFWDVARGHGATLTLLFPAQMSMLLSDPPRPDDRDNDIRLSLSHVTNRAFTERFGVEVLTSCSQTESLGLGVMTPPGFADDAPGLVGPALPDTLEVRIVDELGAEVPRGTPGEICFKHPHLMLGYYRDPVNTANTLRDGWLHTGDRGSMDERGWVTYHGRIKNMIKRMGENIAGEEVEFALMRHPDVEEAVVCGVPDPVRTEEVFAVVHPREGRRVDPAAVIDWLARELSSWKLPRYVQVEPAPFPRLANGKLDRVRLTGQVEPARAWDREAQTAGRP